MLPDLRVMKIYRLQQLNKHITYVSWCFADGCFYCFQVSMTILRYVTTYFLQFISAMGDPVYTAVNKLSKNTKKTGTTCHQKSIFH